MPMSSKAKITHPPIWLSGCKPIADSPNKTVIVRRTTKIAWKQRLTTMKTNPSMTLPMRFKILMALEVFIDKS